MDGSVRLCVREVALFERATVFAHPFRFGAVTVTEAAQAFVRVGVEVAGHGIATGAAAEMVVPKWFDKAPDRTPAQTMDALRASLAAAASAFLDMTAPDTAFGHHAAVLARQADWARRHGQPALVGAYGAAVIDRAILDAVLGALGLGLLEGLRANVPGLDARLSPDLDDDAIAAFLRGLVPSAGVALRHTVGMLDPLDGPEGLGAALATRRLRFFKIKVGGDVAADLERLRCLSGFLGGRVPGFRASLDANESYDSERIAALLRALAGDPGLAALRDGLLYVEQPLDRAATFAAPLGAVAEDVPFIIDEADGTYGAFPDAARLGYRGVSLKGCKGTYKAILNAARAARWNAQAGAPGRFFVTAEDLTCQAGLALQQDTALAAALGLGHAERNGHHYVHGFGLASEAEAGAFLAAHPALYRVRDGRVELAAGDGVLPAQSLLAAPGFADGAQPDWRAMTPLARPTTFQEIMA